MFSELLLCTRYQGHKVATQVLVPWSAQPLDRGQRQGHGPSSKRQEAVGPLEWFDHSKKKKKVGSLELGISQESIREMWLNGL